MASKKKQVKEQSPGTIAALKAWATRRKNAKKATAKK